MRSVELFAGCGGLALGLSQAGFQHELVVELDEQAIATLSENKRKNVQRISDWPIAQKDVRELDYSSLGEPIDLVAGGPPCQPFSIGGKHLGPEDPRNMWPEAIRAVRELTPKAFLFENVRGLLRPAFRDYISYITLYLSKPEIAIREGEHWNQHYARLLKYNGGKKSDTYKVVFRGINTADYGASQKRHRALVLGIRADVATEWAFPEATHSLDSLIWSQYVSKDYWERHGLDAEGARGCVDGDHRLVTAISQQLIRPTESPWRTVRDAIGDLPEPDIGEPSVPGHRLHPGARTYPRHTGSRWDEPAKALKAGDHGVPGGENILAPGDGSVRYFTLREMARLQGFPDQFNIPSGWKAPIKQLGNAVPVQVGEVFGKKILGIISQAETRTRSVAA